jgi:predicted DCC family thiol-disulfide oxidoreductase YuxK
MSADSSGAPAAANPGFDTSITWIVYDGDCPFCTQYMKLVRLRETVGPVKLANAREDLPVVRYVRAKGIDLNQEMALVTKGEVMAGPDVIHRLALLSTGSGFFNGLMSKVFASKGLTKFTYPIMRADRNTTLFLLGRKKIPTPPAE